MALLKNRPIQIGKAISNLYVGNRIIYKQLNNPLYVLGTGLSHNGSAVLLADGKVIVGIEKERITRKKHDGGNDTDAIAYCLKAAGIGLEQVSLVVQCANFEKDEINLIHYAGKRIFPADFKAPVVAISHHLAHAWSAFGTAPFNKGHIFVLDGCGSPFSQCDDVALLNLNEEEMHQQPNAMYCEKDSFYRIEDDSLITLVKDFSEVSLHNNLLKQWKSPTKHSIGGLYSTVSNYCFGNMDDAGKLMGLAPYGTKNAIKMPAFDYADGRVFVSERISTVLTQPASDFAMLKKHFQHYADIACWIQHEVEEAILYTLKNRIEQHEVTHLCYAGGVALNALANARIKRELGLEQLYIEPASGDNGLALGCAYYGWMQVLKQPKVKHDGNTCFGYTYKSNEIEQAITAFANTLIATSLDDVAEKTAELLAQQKILGWYQQGAEFGPRALGRRSILANPFILGVRDFINAEIKCREDFRPFAPSVLVEDVTTYYQHDEQSPYMLLVNTIKPEYEQLLEAVVHKNHTSRTQTVTEQDHPLFYKLITAFKNRTGYGLLLNTSFNKRGMPIVETPHDALDFFVNSKLDYLIMDNILIEKKETASEPPLLEKITDFLHEIGINTHKQQLDEPTFLPGVLIDKGTLIIDEEKLLYPGDLLHEAGHIAVMTNEERSSIRGNVGEATSASKAGGEELSAIAWSYAALKHLGLPPEVVFHPNGYKGASDWFMEQFALGKNIGVPLLQWMGLCYTEAPAENPEIKTYPHLIKWLRD